MCKSFCRSNQENRARSFTEETSEETNGDIKFDYLKWIWNFCIWNKCKQDAGLYRSNVNSRVKALQDLRLWYAIFSETMSDQFIFNFLSNFAFRYIVKNFQIFKIWICLKSVWRTQNYKGGWINIVLLKRLQNKCNWRWL